MVPLDSQIKSGILFFLHYIEYQCYCNFHLCLPCTDFLAFFSKHPKKEQISLLSFDLQFYRILFLQHI